MSANKLATKKYIQLRRQHGAWLVLAARRGPLIIACLRLLFEEAEDGIDLATTQQILSELLVENANSDEFGVDIDNPAAQARKDIRDWIKRRLLIERKGRLYATDALELALGFIDDLGQQRLMTSTASRLSVVQREIENLEINLNPDVAARKRHITNKIADLQQELARLEAGEIEVLTGEQAVEGVREVFNLSVGLRADFRRVEDSYRKADKALRQAIIKGEHVHRGKVLDQLLDGHDDLLETSEGQVFHGFQCQLDQGVEMEKAKRQLRTIINHPATQKALEHQQRNDLRWLFIRLNREAATVLRTRARSERDVKGFIKTGLLKEHHRVGDLLEQIQSAALDIDWTDTGFQKSGSCLPPVAPANSGLPLVERLRIKSLDDNNGEDLELDCQYTELSDMEDDFWSAFDSLDKQVLYHDTLNLLKSHEKPLTIAELVDMLSIKHDLETISYWMSMARQADIEISDNRETFTLRDQYGADWQFQVPEIALDADRISDIEWEL